MKRKLSHMKWCWMGMLIVGFLMACGKKDETKNPESKSVAPVDYLGAVNQAQRSSENRIALLGVQQAIGQFQIMENRLPQNLGELVAKGYLPRLPKAPKGFSIAYDAQTGKAFLKRNSSR